MVSLVSVIRLNIGPCASSFKQIIGTNYAQMLNVQSAAALVDSVCGYVLI